ncbi:MAG: Gfo/Idh/MocA family oxidoreductase [Pseudomonadota bacterium]
MSDFRWGVLSTGRIAEQFAQDLKYVDGAVLGGATSRTAANAQAFARRYGAKHFADFDALLASDEIDGVYIATPHTLHRDNAVAALAAGKPVVCEKPLTVGPEEAMDLLAAANATKVYLMEAMWTWFLPAIGKALEWVEAGRIGPLVHIKADFGYPQRPYSPDLRVYDARLGGGALLEMGIYPVALVYRLTRRLPDAVKVTSRHAPNGVEDDVEALLEFPDCVASIGTSYRCKLPNVAYLVGEEGHIVIPDFWRARACQLFVGEDCIEQFDDGRQSIGLNFETAAAMADIRAGRTESTVVSLNDSLNFQRIIAMIKAGFSGPRAAQ